MSRAPAMKMFNPPPTSAPTIADLTRSIEKLHSLKKKADSYHNLVGGVREELGYVTGICLGRPDDLPFLVSRAKTNLKSYRKKINELDKAFNEIYQAAMKHQRPYKPLAVFDSEGETTILDESKFQPYTEPPLVACKYISDDVEEPTIMQRLFPDLKKPWKLVNLAELHGSAKPIVADLNAQEELLEKAAPEYAFRTYGGFGEDRDQLWFGSGKPQIHLGVDFNQLLPSQKVRSLTPGTVIHVLRDTDKVNGWGARVIVKTPDDRYVLYGHLEHDPLPELKSELKAGDVIGHIGCSETNGGWFSHLHLQYMTREFVDGKNLADIDGYAESMPDGVLDPMTIM